MPGAIMLEKFKCLLLYQQLSVGQEDQEILKSNLK